MALQLSSTHRLFDLIRRNGSIYAIIALLRESDIIYINARDSYGFTPLLLACWSRQESVVRLLIQCGANVDVTLSQDGTSVLQYASAWGWINVVRCLVQKVSDLNAVNFLFACGADGNMEELLCIASVLGWSDIVHVLVKRIPDLNKCFGTKLDSALHVASRSGHLEIVKCLVEEGADINCKNRYTHTPLQIASFRGHLEIVKWLVEGTADINPKRCKDDTSMLVTAQFSARSQKESIKVVRSDVKRNSYLNETNELGFTALAEACLNNKFHVVQYLLEAGASWKIIPPPHLKGDYTCFNISTTNKRPDFEIIKLFIENGAYLNNLDYERLLNSSLKVLQNVKLCTQIIVNQFNNHHLPELYKISVSASLPRIDQMKIGIGSEVVRTIMQSVEFEIKSKGHCNVFHVRPMGLSLIAARSVLAYYDKKK